MNRRPGSFQGVVPLAPVPTPVPIPVPTPVPTLALALVLALALSLIWGPMAAGTAGALPNTLPDPVGREAGITPAQDGLPSGLPEYLTRGGPLLASSHTFQPAPVPLRVNIPKDPFSGLSERFRRLARSDDKRKFWRRALERWEAVASLKPKDREARRRIKSIRSLLRKNANRHFKLAKGHLRKKSYGNAFKEFLRTLSYDAGNRHALTMVKTELNAKSLIEYKVARGDTLRKIARKLYSDPKLSFLVAYFNGLKGNRDLKAGAVLKVPVMAGVIPDRFSATASIASAKTGGKAAKKRSVTGTAKTTPAKRKKKPEPVKSSKVTAAIGTTPASKKAAAETKPAPRTGAEKARTSRPAKEKDAGVSGADIVLLESQGPGRGTAPEEEEYGQEDSRSKLKAAQGLFQRKKYSEAATAAETILEEDPANQKARKLATSAYYAEGRKLNKEKKYLASMQFLSRVDPNYKDVGNLLRQVRGQLKDQQAEVHYIAGVTFFLEEDLEGAIREWEQVLRMDPKHPQAGKDLKNAKDLQTKLARVQ